MVVATRSVTDELASFASSLTHERIPAEVRTRVRNLAFDAIASGLAGGTATEVVQVETIARSLGSAADATVIGSRPASWGGAAFLNGYLITAATVCDVHRPTLFHVTPEVLPPALVLAERGGASGSDLITALAAGLEVATRIASGINYTAFRARGWHSPGVIGPFGGAAGAGRLMRLDPVRMRNALGLAGSQAAGTFAHWGTPTIKFHQARGAFAGTLSALLAESGFEGAADILQADDGGLVNTYTDDGDPGSMVDQLGQNWQLMTISMRRWPVASSLQSMATALFSALARADAPASGIEGVRVRLSETPYRLHGELGFDSTFRARLSARYVTSVIVRDRACWLDQFSPARIADPALADFAGHHVQVEPDEELPRDSASVAITLSDGQEVVERCDSPLGDAANPLSFDDIADKFREAARGRLDAQPAARLISLFERLESVDDVRGPLLDLRATP